MNAIHALRKASLAVALVTGFTAQSMAHCDTMNGPVVEAARQAIAHNDVRYALIWVKPAGEGELRKAFEQTMAVRGAGPAARELADRYFFETLVRVHRAGEGAPYTGLKEAGLEPEPGIAAAEAALNHHSAADLQKHLAAMMGQRIEQALHRVHKVQEFQPTDVEAGRAYVEAYVHFIHTVDGLYRSVAPTEAAHEEHAGH